MVASRVHMRITDVIDPADKPVDWLQQLGLPTDSGPSLDAVGAKRPICVALLDVFA